MVNVIETERLALRRACFDDAGFFLELLNEPAFVRNIGDKGVRTVEDARLYIQEGPVLSYDRFGFGIYVVELKEAGEAIGVCGLVKRESLADVDVGYAFLPRYWSKGYALESAAAVMRYGREELGLRRIVAVVNAGNSESIKVLSKLGLKFNSMVRLAGDERELQLFTPDV